MPGDTMLLERGTTLNRLKPVNIVQAAQKDLRLRERKKENEADPDEMYSFARKHVARALGVGHLIALAYFDPAAAEGTDKRSTYIVYKDRDLLRTALREILDKGEPEE